MKAENHIPTEMNDFSQESTVRMLALKIKCNLVMKPSFQLLGIFFPMLSHFSASQ